VSLRLHNTVTGRKEPFEPLDPSNLRIYVCGLTVYGYAHIGNARPMVVFDQLARLLRHLYGDEHVTYATNVTDIDDKIMARAEEEGRSVQAVAEEYTAAYEEDLTALNILPPDIFPKATETIEAIQAMIARLIERGCAYTAEGHVLFHVPAMDDYGKLSHRERDEMIAGARVDVAPYKKDPADFVLWKPSSDDQPGWDSPWSRGRPGWHIECSAMIAKHLGETIDIHGGGADLIFPHHENETAQSECAHGKPFVRYWLHNGMLNLKGEKMAKSVGNVESVRDLLAEYPGEAIRLALLTGHYRAPLDFDRGSLNEAKRRLDRWYRILRDAPPTEEREVPDTVIKALKDDLNTPKTIAALEELASPETVGGLKAGANFLGLLTFTPNQWFGKTVKIGRATEQDQARALHDAKDISQKQVEEKISARAEARKAKDFAKADAIRDELAAAGIKLLDRPDGSTDWERTG